jgi:hypothetical protein
MRPKKETKWKLDFKVGLAFLWEKPPAGSQNTAFPCQGLAYRVRSYVDDERRGGVMDCWALPDTNGQRHPSVANNTRLPIQRQRLSKRGMHTVGYFCATVARLSHDPLHG